MKYWVLGLAAVGVALVVVGIIVGLGTGESKSSIGPPNSPPPTLQATPLTATPPSGCGGGDWDDCEKQATTAALQAYSDKYRPSPNSIAVVSSEYVQWPDSCLGVSTPEIACAQVITPGFRVVVRSEPTLPQAEYHTDLTGHAVAFATMTVAPAPSR